MKTMELKNLCYKNQGDKKLVSKTWVFKNSCQKNQSVKNFLGYFWPKDLIEVLCGAKSGTERPYRGNLGTSSAKKFPFEIYSFTF